MSVFELFFIVCADLALNDLLSESETLHISEEGEMNDCKSILTLIGKIQCVKSPSVMTKTAEVLKKSGFTEDCMSFLQGKRNS